MSKLQLINTLFTQARLNRDEVRKSCLSTMKGEIENALKTEGADEDQIIVNYCLKSKKNLLEYKPAGYEIELSIIEQFLPRQLTGEEIQQEIHYILNPDPKEKTKANFGYFMGLCSKELKGRADVNIIKSLLNQALS